MKIAHELKIFLDIFIPIIASVIICIVFVNIDYKNMLGESSFVSNITSLLGILIGFFIASLAAVSTFERPEMDYIMEGNPPILYKQYLTKRQFLCYLFGYLSYASIIVIIIGDIINLYSNDIFHIIRNNTIIYIIIFVPYFFIVMNIFMTLFLGLSFLTENIHKQKQKVIIRDNYEKNTNKYK
ncbi:hypothetical protein ACPV5G_19940 [Photobacterium damselae]|uniref:hypothetical protein n=1 Tax=Photobacterium damselae TaxID=38293 RepID=UPI004068FB9C